MKLLTKFIFYTKCLGDMLAVFIKNLNIFILPVIQVQVFDRRIFFDRPLFKNFGDDDCLTQEHNFKGCYKATAQSIGT